MDYNLLVTMIGSILVPVLGGGLAVHVSAQTRIKTLETKQKQDDKRFEKIEKQAEKLYDKVDESHKMLIEQKHQIEELNAMIEYSKDIGNILKKMDKFIK